MQTGRPVLTSNLSSMPEVAGSAACLVDPFDVISIRNGLLKIVNNEEFRNNLIATGFENYKRFDAQRIAEMYFDLYRKVGDEMAN